MWLWGAKCGEICLTPDMTAHHSSPSTPIYLSGHRGKVFLLCKKWAAGARGLHAKQPPIKAKLVWPEAAHRVIIPPSHFPSLLSGSLTRLSSFSSFSISTSGPFFFTSWPFFSCKETKQDKTVSREDSRDEEGSDTERAAGVLCLSSHPSVEADPQGDASAHPHISSPRCHEMCESSCELEKDTNEVFGWERELIC